MPADKWRSGYQYRCIVTNSRGVSTTSRAATLTAHVFWLEPKDVSGPVGSTVIFTAGADGENLRWQWQYSTNGGASWSVQHGRVSDRSSYTEYPGAAPDGWQYRCIVSGAGGSIISDAAKLSVYPQIKRQPVSVRKTVGETAEFTVEADGTDLSYQWQYSADGSTWAASTWKGAKTPTLYVPAALKRSGYQYRCIVTGSSGVSTTSRAATLTVSDFYLEPRDVSGPVGSTAIFTAGAYGENLHWQWQYSTDGGATWENTRLSGAARDWLTVPVTADKEGWFFRCIVTGTGGAVISDAVQLQLFPQITKQPQAVSAKAGETAVFTVEAAGEGLSYQWQYCENSAMLFCNTSWSGAQTPTLRVPAALARGGYYYRCVVTGANGLAVDSEPAQLTVLREQTAPQITKQPEDVTAEAGELAYFTSGGTCGGGYKSHWEYSTDGVTWRKTSFATVGYYGETLQIPAAASRNGYQYRYVITHTESGSTAVSNPAKLIVK